MFIYSIFVCKIYDVIGFLVFLVLGTLKINDIQNRYGLWVSLQRACRPLFYAVTVGVEFLGSE